LAAASAGPREKYNPLLKATEDMGQPKRIVGYKNRAYEGIKGLYGASAGFNKSACKENKSADTAKTPSNTGGSIEKSRGNEGRP